MTEQELRVLAFNMIDPMEGWDVPAASVASALLFALDVVAECETYFIGAPKCYCGQDGECSYCDTLRVKAKNAIMALRMKYPREST